MIGYANKQNFNNLIYLFIYVILIIRFISLQENIKTNELPCVLDTPKNKLETTLQEMTVIARMDVLTIYEQVLAI